MCVLSRDQDPAWWRKRGERRRRNGIRSLEPMSWHQPQLRTLGAGIALTHNTGGRKHVMRVFWCLSFGSVPHHRSVTFPGSWSKQTRPLSDLIILTLLSSSSDPDIILRAVSGHCTQLIMCYWHWERIHLCNAMINIYISDRYSMSSRRLFSGCVSICVSSRAQPPWLMIRLWRMGHTRRGKKPSGSYLAFQQILTSLSQFVIQSPACWERRAGNYHQA